MNQQEINTAIIKYLKPYRPEKIGLFGSYARQEHTENSDIDILARFKETISLLDLARIHRELSSVLGKKVDLVTEGALKNEKLKKYIYQDLQIIFE
jgi:predicted nucleotidyltransferase